MLAQPQGLLSVHQQEAEHHLDAQQQRVEIPIDGRLVQQLNMIAGRNAAKGGHAHAVQISCILVDQIIIVVVQNRCGQGKGPVLELLEKPPIYWDFHSLLLGIQMMFSFMLVGDAKPLRLCKHCQKVFLGSRANSAFCSARCKNQYNVYKSRGKNKGQDGENDD